MNTHSMIAEAHLNEGGGFRLAGPGMKAAD